ncbi:MAG: hypothetical protein ACR2P9_02320 [Gammaproteobacteria bacterium]
MKALLNYPVFYCVVGIALSAIFRPIRAEWWGLLVLSFLLSLYAFLTKDEADLAHRYEVGDNCYFIGFVYTLAVITWSLMLDTDSLLSNKGGDLLPLLTTVGIALGTSVVGMIWRFGLTHGWKPPEDEFDRAVTKAAVAATELEVAVVQVNECVTGVEQTMSQVTNAMSTYSRRTEEETQKIGRAMSNALGSVLEDFSARIAESLQKTHFDDVREALQATLDEHRAAVLGVNQAFSQSLEELNTATKATTTGVEDVRHALSSLNAINDTVQAFSEGVENLNKALKTISKEQTALIGNAEHDVQRMHEARDALDDLIKTIRSDVKSIAEIKESYRRAFDEAAQTALEETHRLYGRLITGAKLALGGIDNLDQIAKDLRTIAQNIEQEGNNK